MRGFERLFIAGALVATGCSSNPLDTTPETLTPMPTATQPAYPNQDCLHEIEPGETLSGIGNEIGLSFSYLMVENNIKQSAYIQAGAILDICFNQIDDETGELRADPYNRD